jgi:tetratricopeptide (TPR) repeat protein
MQTIKELITTGKQYFENKEYVRAEEYLSRVIEMGVKYADVFNMLGVISHIQGKFASAIEYFHKALEINPRYTEATLNLTVLYNDLGQYSDAKKLYFSLKNKASKSSAQIEPVLRGKLSNMHADIGDVYRSIGLYSNAIDEYIHALSLNPGYSDIRTKLGQALRESGDKEESLKELSKVLKQNPTYVPALLQIGITHYSLNNLNEAKAAWNKATALNSNSNLANMYIRLCDSASPNLVASKGRGKPRKTKRAVQKKKASNKRKRT